MNITPSLGKILITFLILLLFLEPNISLSKLTDATIQHLENLRVREIQLSKDPQKADTVNKIRKEIHRIETEFQLPLTEFRSSAPNTEFSNKNRPNSENPKKHTEEKQSPETYSSSENRTDPPASSEPKKRVVGYDQFGRSIYEYECQASFSLIL